MLRSVYIILSCVATENHAAALVQTHTDAAAAAAQEQNIILFLCCIA